MADAKEQVLFENEAYKLTDSKLIQADLTAELEGIGKLVITRKGERREVCIPALPAGCVGMRSNLPVLTAMYNLAVHELHANVQPDGRMLAGANWSTVWTRDIAYAATLGAGIVAPEAVRASLMSRVKDGVVMQDTGTGGGWPISTDRVAWAMGAWCLYQAEGDLKWLEYCIPVLQATLAQDDGIMPARTPLRSGETSFIDWREQSYPDWMTSADIGASYAFGTNVLHYTANLIVARMLTELERTDEAAAYSRRAEALDEAIEQTFWSKANNQYSMMRTPDGCPDDRTDALANALAVISGLAGDHAERAMNGLRRSPWGTPVFAPYKSGTPEAYHNRAVWPFEEAFVLLAHAELRDPVGARFSMASILRAAMAFGTNKENFRAETGEAAETLQNSDRQLWSVAGMLGLFYYGLFGIQYEHDNLVFAPCVPRSFAGSHWLTNLHIRDMVLTVRINGYGTDICSVRINGKAGSPIIPLDTTGNLQIEIELMPVDDEEPEPDYPKAQEDLPEPEWDAPTPGRLSWLPVPGATEYYIFANGKALGATPECSFAVSRPAPFCTEYRLQAVNRSNASNLSRPWVSCEPGARILLQPTLIGNDEAEYEVENRQAWLDTRPCTERLRYESVTLAAGTYELRIQYSNATAALSDGDTCALRELLVDGEPAGIIPLPHNTDAGNWECYSLTAAVPLALKSGRHTFELRYTPATCTNANGRLNQCMVRAIELTRRA